MTIKFKTPEDALAFVRVGQLWRLKDGAVGGRTRILRITRISDRHYGGSYVAFGKSGSGRNARAVCNNLARGTNCQLVEDAEAYAPPPKPRYAPEREPRVRGVRVKLPRMAPGELETLRDRALEYEARYGAEMASSLLGIGAEVLRSLVSQTREVA